MNIAFRVDISESIGTGHYMRMSVLAEAFADLGCTFQFFKGEDEPVDYCGFDIVIIDTYEVNDAYIAGLKASDRVVVCYDDNSLYTYCCDVLLNANFHASKLAFRIVGVPPRQLLGTAYALLRKEFSNALPIKVNRIVKNIFICFGGSDLQHFTTVAIKALKDIPNVKLTVVLGAYTTCDVEVAKLASKKVCVVKTPHNIVDVMVSCDMAVTAGGSMVYELASLGLPTVIVTQADNQHLIAQYLEENNLMRWAGDYATITPEILRSAVYEMMQNSSYRKEMSMLLVNTVNRNGASNAAREILGVANETFGKN